MKLMARIAAECLVAPMFKGIFKTLSDHNMEQISYRLNGKFVQYDPQSWRDQYDMTINVGIGTGDVQQQQQFLMQIAQSQAAVAGSPFAAKLLSPQEVFNVQARLAENAGFKNPAEFWLDPATVPDQPPAPNPVAELEKAKLQDSQQKAQAEMTQKANQAELDRNFEAQQAELTRQHELELEAMRIQSQERIRAIELMHETERAAQASFHASAPRETGAMNITIDGSRPVHKTARAVRQEDGSYVMESIEVPAQ